MSVTVVIKEGGLGKSLTVDKLKTNVSGGGTQLWIPEKNMATKTITKNGTYEAKDDDVPGWNKVIVNVAGGEDGSITGRDPDTGEDVNVSVDPETGDIVETVVPSSIRIVTPPTRTVYSDGDTINFSGIVVHGYSKSGQDLGVIPFNQLVFPVTVADSSGEGGEWTDGGGVHAKMLYYRPQYYRYGQQGQEHLVYVHTPGIGSYQGTAGSLPATLGQGGDKSPGRVLITKYNNILYVAGVGQRMSVDLYAYSQGRDTTYGEIYGWHLVGGTSAFAPQDRFDGFSSWSDEITDVPSSTVNPTTVDPTSMHGGEGIPVQWVRTGDGQVLEDRFTITVN